jgi:alpha-1,2-mannosyltransferase
VLAAILWFIASVGGLVYIVKESFAQFLDRLDRRRSLLALAGIAGVMLWTPPVRDTLWFGQINLILAALVLTDCLRPRKRQGVLVGVATAMKLTPGLFIVYFIVARKGRSAVRALVTVAVCWGGAALLLPTASRQYWFHAAFDVNRPGRPGYWTNQTIDGFISRYHGPHWLWIPLGVIVAVLGLWRAREAHRSGNELAAVVLVGLTSVLVSPISWLHTQVWFVAAIGVILGRGTERRRVMAAGGVLILLLARLSMLGDRLARIYHVPVIGNVIENAYVFLLLFVIAVLPVRDPPEGEITPPSNDLSIRGALVEAWRG